ncbi:MAG: LamG-like jellyroll fold domain-containing protein [Armatimonadota bacterium]|nr:LamG-like jellyroll fold domain-containing protein [Armatimonadota bacterium]
MKPNIVVMVLGLLLACPQLSAAQGAWWNPGWRYRTTITRPTPWRCDGRQPAEAAIDFAALLARAEGTFDPASVRVVDPVTGSQVPCALRTEWDPRDRCERRYVAWYADARDGHVGSYDVYFETADASVQPAHYRGGVPPENLLTNPGFEDIEEGLPAGWEISVPELASAARFENTTGQRSLRLHVDADTPEDLAREVAISQTVDVSQFAGGEAVFECDLLAERGKYGTPTTVQLIQLREDGSRIPEFVVQPRWMTVEMAPGQLVQWSERGRINPEAAQVQVVIRLRLSAGDAWDGTPLTEEEKEYTTWLDRVTFRPGERWPWPGASHGCFVEGALQDAPLNRAVDFIGDRRLTFNGGSEGTLTGGDFNPNRRSVHWGPQRGTLEMWVRPHWSTSDDAAHELLYAKAYMHKTQSQLRVVGGDDPALEFSIADSDRKYHTVRGPVTLEPERWYHLAATWDLPQAHLQIFVDGGLIAEEGPGDEPWPSTMDPEDPDLELGRGIVDEDRRSVPMQATIGGDNRWRPGGAADAVIDEVRISDVVRYQGGFEPPRSEFEVDEATRALFHFDHEEHGTHAGDDRFVEAYFVCEQHPQSETAPLEIRRGDEIQRRDLAVAPHAPEALYERNRAENVLQVYRPVEELPDPRHVALVRRTLTRTVQGDEEPFTVEVGGDLEPLMLWSRFRRSDDASGETTLIPRWRANDSVVPFSWEDLHATLAPHAETDAERALGIFRYSLQTTNYYDAHYCEDLGTKHRDRISYTLIRALNIYPFDQCGPLNYTLRKLFLAGGISSNDAPGTHHQFEQGFYDGSLRLFDLSPRQYWLDRDNETVISLRKLGEDPWLKIRQGGNINAWIPGRVSSARFSSVRKSNSIDVPLRPGEQVCFGWQNEGEWMALSGEREPIHMAKIPPYYGNGILTWEPTVEGEAAVAENAVIERDGKHAVIRAEDDQARAGLTYRVLLPYTLAAARVAGRYSGPAALSLSWDDGGTWAELWRSERGEGEIDVDLTPHVMARYNYWLRLELPAGSETRISDLSVRSTFNVSPLSLPGALELGENQMSFVRGPVTEPVEAELAWLERRRSDLGVSLNALSFYLMDDENHRNLYIARPGEPMTVEVSLEGHSFDGAVTLEGLPEGWGRGSISTKVTTDGEPTTATFALQPDREAGRIAPFEVVVRQADSERRVPAVVLLSAAALVAEAEEADLSGEATTADAPVQSGGRQVDLTGDGSMAFDADAPADGTYALWLRARWEQGASTRMVLTVDGEEREVRATAMIGFTDWENPRQANTKMFAHYGEQYKHWAWYRIPDLELTAGEHRVELSARAGTRFDCLAILPQTDVMDRAAMNLLHTWNFAPWLLPM